MQEHSTMRYRHIKYIQNISEIETHFIKNNKQLALSVVYYTTQKNSCIPVEPILD